MQTDEVDLELIKTIKSMSNDEDDEVKSFFASLVPRMKRLNNYQCAVAQQRILATLMEIEFQSGSAPTTAYQTQTTPYPGYHTHPSSNPGYPTSSAPRSDGVMQNPLNNQSFTNTQPTYLDL